MTVQITDDNKVRTFTLNRPAALNAFNEALYDAMTVALRDAAEDPDIAVVLLTGAGRAFSSGNDLNDLAVAPEAASSDTLAQLTGRQNAAWLSTSSE